MAQQSHYCPHCGFANQYLYNKPTTCSRCKRSLSFEVKGISTADPLFNTQHLAFQIPVLTAAEQSFINKNKDTMLPIEICQRIFGEVSSTGPEMSAIRNFLNGIGQGVSPKPSSPSTFSPQIIIDPSRQIIIDDNYVPDNNNYDEGEENDNVSKENLPNVKSLSFTVETGPSATSMSVEDAVFKYSMRPENKPERLKKPKGFNAKKELARVRQQASSISKKTNTIRADVNKGD
jgi:hypothetical protein